MLQLPDVINEELTSSYSKTDIQTIKEELDEESKVSDIEVYLEDKPKMPESECVDEKTELLYQTLYNLFKAEPELYVEICKIEDPYEWGEGEDGGLSVLHEKIRSVIAPSGEKMYSTRIPGRGRAMLMINEESYKITLLRTSEKLEYSDKEMEDGFTYCGMWGDGSPEERWEGFYGENFPVAPEQQKNDKPKWGENAKNPVNTRKDKDRKVVKAAVEQNVREVKKEEKVEAEDKGESSEEGDTAELHGSTGQDVGTGKSNQVRGYKAAVTNNLNTLRSLWEGDNSRKIKLMLDVVEDLKWRLEQIQKGV
jgi:hypothetical protein